MIPLTHEKKLAIIILNWNGKHDTIACIASLQPTAATIIVVDNGSSDGSAAAIRNTYPDITVLETGKNLGYAGGNNIGIKHALSNEYQLILILNNDTVASPKFIQELIAETERDANVGIFGGKPCLLDNPARLDHLGGVWNAKTAEFLLIGNRAPASFNTQMPLDYVCGCAMLIRRTVFEKIGLFDPDYFLFWEEADFCMRAKKAGFENKICNNAILLHKVSASFSGGKPHTTYFWWRNRLRWMKRNLKQKDYQLAVLFKITPEVLRIGKHFMLKKIQIHWKQMNGQDKTAAQKQLQQYRAALAGVFDYLRKKTDQGPEWIYKNNSPS